MSELASEEVRTLTEQEINHRAGLNEDIQRSSPEFEAACASYINILGQLTGQAKSDFFHMRHFQRNFGAQDALWQKMVEADGDAAAWKTALDTQRQANTEEQEEEKRRQETLPQELASTIIESVADHPYAYDQFGARVGDYEGQWRGQNIRFRLTEHTRHYTQDSNERWQELTIEISQTPTPFDPKQEAVRSTSASGVDPRGRELLRGQEAGKYSLVKAGVRIHLLSVFDSGSPKTSAPSAELLIDRQDYVEAGQDSFVALRAAEFGSGTWTFTKEETPPAGLLITAFIEGNAVAGKGQSELEEMLNIYSPSKIEEVLQLVKHAKPVEKGMQQFFKYDSSTDSSQLEAA